MPATPRIHEALAAFDVIDDGGLVIARGAVPSTVPRSEPRRLRQSATSPDWSARLHAVVAGRRAMAFDLRAGNAEAICEAIEQVRATGFAAAIRLSPDGGPGCAAVASADRIAGQLDPTRVATEWRTWLQAAGVLTSRDDDALDALVSDLTLRRPRFVDWLDQLAARTLRDGFGDLRGMAVEGVILGDAAAVRAARLLSERTGDERYWQLVDSSRSDGEPRGIAATADDGSAVVSTPPSSA